MEMTEATITCSCGAGPYHPADFGFQHDVFDLSKPTLLCCGACGVVMIGTTALGQVSARLTGRVP